LIGQKFFADGSSSSYLAEFTTEILYTSRMTLEPPIIKGRGSNSNPKSRFEKIEVSFDGLDDHLEHQEFTRPQTTFYNDSSRTILSENSSPDIPYRYGLNPYRGCEHGCSYCLSGDTPILMADGSTRPISELRVGDEIYGTIREGWYRRYAKTQVLAHWKTLKPAFQVTLEDGTRLVASGDHRFFTERGWKHVSDSSEGRPHLTTNNKLMGVGQFAITPTVDEAFKTGYLCGMIRADGSIGSYHYSNPNGGDHQHRFRLALIDPEGLERAKLYLHGFGVETREFTFQKVSEFRAEIRAIRTDARAHIERIHQLIAWPEHLSDGWCRGFLAGLFDAEGSYSNNALRISNTNPEIIEHFCESLERFGFRFVIETQSKNRVRPIQAVRLLGGLVEHLKFFHMVQPAIRRKCNLEGQAVKSQAKLGVVAIERVNTEIEMYDITTGTEDFIANGVISHNCFARPYHEYLGFSSGLDFETKIAVKMDAPELLRKAFSSRRWQPQAITMSAITDVYQPVERKLQLTRKCLEVFLDFRNPVTIITKNHLVTRDLDLLGELAHFDCASVAISLTSLDDDLRLKLEPRTSSPSRRLAAIEALAKAGVPVGVMVAPIIPGLTDHEVPALVKAAVDAGAQWAAYTIVRLPFAVEEIFTDWLEQHVPARKAKVLHRIQELRGGKLNSTQFGLRMSGEGVFADSIRALFKTACRQTGLEARKFKLSTEHFRIPGPQANLFE
jgi:DNA repair photolyase